MDTFAAAYKALNTEQKRAVDTIDGPVMVIAGPGTGKTQVLALRIAHILNSTDTPPDGILCLTFTNAGVKAMRERLLGLIGPTATRVRIATFHSFGLELIEEYFAVLGFDRAPVLLDDGATVALFDDVLQSREWSTLRPRNNPSLYYYDLKSLISALKRDGISPEVFAAAVTRDIDRIEHDPNSISSRGETKGQMKKDAEKKIESLQRSLEAADFYRAYEALKSERTQIDYNDVLTLMVRIATESEDGVASIRERFLYVLVDEHQDSSGVQNAFLEAVWASVERPNLFVVGDDRQLIYGFGGASLAYFEGFSHTFVGAVRITLLENYRSTQTILNTAESLLTSRLAEGKLRGSDAHTYPIELVECAYPRDEVVAAGTAIKKYLADGIDPNQCAILVPKNRQVQSAITILTDIGIPVASKNTRMLFELSDTQSLLNILRVLNNPHDSTTLSRLILDPLSGIAPLVAHAYLYGADTRKLSLGSLLESGDEQVKVLGERLSEWLTTAQSVDVYTLIQMVGGAFLLEHAESDEALRVRAEIIRTLLHLVMAQVEHPPAPDKSGGRAGGNRVTLATFIEFVDRLIEYNEDIPLAVFGANHGVKVLTLHGSKGLEFDAVWIAHMDERSFMAQKRGGFVLPEDIQKQEIEAAEDIAKRQLYVAITRAKRFCTISYATQSHAGADQKLASIIEALPEGSYTRTRLADVIPDREGLRASVSSDAKTVQPTVELIDLVRDAYPDRKVSVTMLNNFFECPWKWYFRSLLQLPEPLTESLHVGNVTHKAIEYILDKKGNDTSPESIDRYLNHCAAIEARYDDALAKRLVQQVQKIIDVWMKEYYPTISAPYDKEQNLNYRDPDFAHLSITGKIDLIEQIITGEVRVTDWKTGSPKTKADIEKEDENGRMSGLLRQLTMYSYLIDGHSHGDMTVSESRLVFLEAKRGDKNAIHSRKISRDDIERLRGDIKDYNELLKSGEWINEKCLAKTYGNETECSYCALAQKIYTPKAQNTK